MNPQTEGNSRLGYEDVGRGRPVVLLHAFPLARAMWRPQIETLRDRYRVVAPDLPGFGDTAGFTGPPSVEAMAERVNALLDRLGIAEPVALGGLSMGGYVALAFARKYPGRLAALVLADTRSEADSAEAKANRDQLMAFAAEHTARDVFEQLLPRLVSHETITRRPEVVEELRRIAAAQTTAGIIDALRALRDRPDAGPWLGQIRVPTLVLVGSEDALTPPALAEGLAGRIRGAQLVILPGAGHLANLEQPEAFNRALSAFLAALDPARGTA